VDGKICLGSFCCIRQIGLGYGLTFERPSFAALDAASPWAMGYMVILPMAICTLTWFAALRRLPPAAASTSMLLVPVRGIISGSLLLGEPLGARGALAMTLALGRVVVTLRTS
jgi:drug/metabolite transporter (DMT)-like permease